MSIKASRIVAKIVQMDDLVKVWEPSTTIAIHWISNCSDWRSGVLKTTKLDKQDHPFFFFHKFFQRDMKTRKIGFDRYIIIRQYNFIIKNLKMSWWNRYLVISLLTRERDLIEPSGKAFRNECKFNSKGYWSACSITGSGPTNFIKSIPNFES